VHADRLGDLGAEVLDQEGEGDVLVAGVDAVVVDGPFVDEVPLVVQERGCDEPRRRAVALGRVRALEHVLGERDLLAEVLLGALLAEDAEDLVDDRVDGHRRRTASRLRSPSRSA
jgi:hypothetical protein